MIVQEAAAAKRNAELSLKAAIFIDLARDTGITPHAVLLQQRHTVGQEPTLTGVSIGMRLP